MSDELGFNKIAGAVLATALAFIGVREIAHAAYHPHTPAIPAYGADILAAAEAAAGAGAAEVIELPFPQQDWLDAMNASMGETIAKKCVACHTFVSGGSNATGPNLYGIVGKAAAQTGDYAYSTAMSESGITWDFETLNDYLEKPSRYVKGTNMIFVGLKKPEQRAAVIEYLRMQADTPIERPTVAATVEMVVEDALDMEGVVNAPATHETVTTEEPHDHTDGGGH